MAGSRRVVILATGLLLVVVSNADAYGCRQWHSNPMPTNYGSGFGCFGGRPLYMPPAAAIQVRPVPRDPEWARPKPALPSSTEPPLPGSPKKAPTITETRSLGGSYTATKSTAKQGRCLVGFWNLSGRDVTLKVNGEKRVIAKDKAITLELEHQFVWQVDRSEPAAEQVPSQQLRHEVMIRE